MSIFKRKIRKIVEKVFPMIAPDYVLLKKNKISTIESEIAGRGVPSYLHFDSIAFKRAVIGYIDANQVGSFEWKFAQSSLLSSIYSSVYSCLILSMFGEISNYSQAQKSAWIDYFDTFQSEVDGLFYDKNIENEIYAETDWWGARHLCPHIINAYIALGGIPKYDFKYLMPYYDTAYLKQWLDETDWNSAIMDDSDIDNKIMNIGVMLQFQRDFKADKEAGVAIAFLKQYLKSKINPLTGLWGNYNIDNRIELCRMIQFSYHLLRIFIYDNESIDQSEKIIDLILSSQNQYGGFGARNHSSACEDIDAIDPLVYLSQSTNYRKHDIQLALKQAFIYILANQNDDGGFVFRRDEALWYGHEENMTARRNESAMFPTWFRTLSIAYIARVLSLGNFNLVKSPGY